MKGIDQSVINQIIDQVDIVEEISKDIALTKKGANFVGLCPFHDDNNPSFIVSPTKKICNCFVCKQGGNVINFRQKYNIDFVPSILYFDTDGVAHNIDHEVSSDNFSKEQLEERMLVYTE